MANLKNRILETLRSGKNLETILNDLSRSQENLLKNHSNPVFNSKDKNKILKQYTNLNNIGKSLYRYNTLNENNLESDSERTDIENTVLKGGISYNKYVWHSENGEHTCDECRALDGKVFDFYDEVPERPHPNCRCTVEVVEDSDIEDDKNPKNNTSSQEPQPELPQPNPQNPPKPKKWIMPCNGPIVGQYGEPRTTHVHNGIDIAVPVGTPIKAVADGTVVVTGPTNGYGYWVGINHGLVNGNIVSSEYGHLSKWIVNNGQKVKQGQIIAYSGNTGYSQGPHLHLTIRHGNPGKGGGIAVSPWIYIDNTKY